MTKVQRESLNYIGGQLKVLKLCAKDEAKVVVSDVLDAVVSLLETDEATE